MSSITGDTENVDAVDVKTGTHDTSATVFSAMGGGSQTNKALVAPGETMKSNGGSNENQQSYEQGSLVTGTEVLTNLITSTTAQSAGCDGESTNGTTPVSDPAPTSSATNGDADQTKQEEGRRGSEFLLIAAQAAEAAEVAEKAQSRNDAIRKAAVQLTSPPPRQNEQKRDLGAMKDSSNLLSDGMMTTQNQNALPAHNGFASTIKIDEQLKQQVYNVAAMMQSSGNLSQLLPMPMPGRAVDGTLHIPNRPKPSNKPRPLPVKHVYHDYASAPTPIDLPRKKTGGVSQPFPDKLMTMLDRETAACPDVISWCPHGRAFIVKKPKVFTAEVMTKYFRQSKLTSFQRQLNLYGFRRITQGIDAGAYYHELFLRGRSDLTFKMVRQKVKGTGHKQPTDASTEPNFYSMPQVVPLNEAMNSGHLYPGYNAPIDHVSTKPPPNAVPDGTLYTNSSRNAPAPSPSLQAVAALRRLSNPALGAPTNFSLGAPAAQVQPPQPPNSNNASWSGYQPDPYQYQMQPPLDPSSLSTPKAHGFQPPSTLGSCPVASEAAATMAQMFSTPGPDASENGGTEGESGVKTYPV